jgi:hypothetical protein
VSTVVANEPALSPVIGHRNRTIKATLDVAAVQTLHKRGIPSSVQQQNGLLFPFETVSYGFDQALGQHHTGLASCFAGTAIPLPLLPQVDQVNRRQLPPTHPVA